MTSRSGELVLRTLSRVKRSIHHATAPRTPPTITAPGGRSAADVDRLVRLFFPDGVTPQSDAEVRSAFQQTDLSASAVRNVLGGVDQQSSPSPFSVRLSNEDVVFVTLAGIEVALDRTDRAVSIPIIQSGQWEPHVAAVIGRLLAPGLVFVDVGANVGWNAALASSIVGDRGMVHAVEPNPDNARLIAHTIHTNALTNVRLLPIALGERIGYSMFRSAVGSNGGFVGGAHPLDLDPYVTVVPTLRLDDLDIERVDVIKIDVEGAEAHVLHGAIATIERDHPAIVFEFSCEMAARVGGAPPPDHLRLLRSLGYDLSLIERPGGDLVPIPDVDRFLAEWGDPLRIEDLLAVVPDRAS